MPDAQQTIQDQDASTKDVPYEAPAIVALGDVNTETLQTGIPGG